MAESHAQIALARPSDSSSSCECLTTLDEIRHIAPQWEILLQRSVCNRAFSSPHWFMAAYQCQPAARLHVIIMRRNGSLAGVFPLVVDTDKRVAQFATSWNDYHDMITEAGDSEAMCALLRHACTRATGYDSLALHRLRYDSNCFHALSSSPEPQWKKHFGEDPTKYAYAPLPSSYEEYLDGLPNKFRKNLLYLKRKARDSIYVRELHPASFDPAELPEAFLSLHLARFGQRTSFAEESEQKFVRSLFPRLFATGSLRAFALFEKEKIVAVSLNLVGSNSLCLWNGGFIPEAEHWSPGTLLTDAALHCACDASLSEYDFLRGTENYKMNWSCKFRAVGSLELPTGAR